MKKIKLFLDNIESWFATTSLSKLSFRNYISIVILYGLINTFIINPIVFLQFSQTIPISQNLSTRVILFLFGISISLLINYKIYKGSKSFFQFIYITYPVAFLGGFLQFVSQQFYVIFSSEDSLEEKLPKNI